MENNIEYRMGRITCKTGIMYLQEGLITDSKQITVAFETLQMYRSYPGGVEWISEDTRGIVPTEKKADEVLDFLREQFSESLNYAGEKPLECAHGKVFFRKIAQLTLTIEQEKKAGIGIANILGVTPNNISNFTFGWR